MEDNFYISNYLNTKSYNNKHNRKLKKNQSKNVKCSFKQSEDDCVYLNLNKNKNWLMQKKLKEKISLDPEYGEIKTNKNKIEIIVYKPESKVMEQSFTFKNEKISNVKSSKKSQNSKKNHKNKTKSFISIQEDFFVIEPQVQKVEKPSDCYERIIYNLENLAHEIGQNSDVKFKSFNDLVCSESLAKEFKINETTDNDQISKRLNINFECAICCTEKFGQIVLTKCGHGCCSECWKNYIKNSNEFLCLFPQCNEKLDLAFLKTLTFQHELPKIEQNYHKFWLSDQNLVECSYSCQRILLKSNKNQFIQCPCNYRICTKCNLESHYPITCEQYKFYVQNFVVKLKIGVTEGKFCPSCKSFIEKNGGCSHMNCVCGKVFCWECLQDYRYSHEKCEPVKTFSMNFKDSEEKALKYSLILYEYQNFVLSPLKINLNNETNFLKAIKSDLNYKKLLVKISKYFKFGTEKSSNLIDLAINDFFEIIHRTSEMIELAYVGQIFNKINDLKTSQNGFSKARKLENLCKRFNRILSRSPNLTNLQQVFFIWRKFLLSLQMLKF
ncbi:unnamed protein product [Brachionus calyciflorus]|uniref:RBR-type E3 ubiquitin transferase n=1 Tax=Brachionus calyciflorus TaxID=104777 RepID=A0A814JLR5_9BILA|nr:unnamed protein product [Brachionus calyciflorus]